MPRQGKRGKMNLPPFIKELLWCFYAPKYKELSRKPFKKSLKFMSAVLLIAFLISGVLYLPKVFLLKRTIEEELSKFDSFSIAGNVTQTAPINIPRWNPWIVIDLNDNVKLKKEFLVIDKETVQYRLLGIKQLPREQLKEIASYRATVSSFLTIILLLMLPGIAILLYIRLWLKYFLLVLLMGTLFFIILDLTKWKQKWKQMLSIAAHAITGVILLETVSAFVTTIFLVPLRIKFVGLGIYLVSLIIYAGMMIYGIVGSNIAKDGEEK